MAFNRAKVRAEFTPRLSPCPHLLAERTGNVPLLLKWNSARWARRRNAPLRVIARVICRRECVTIGLIEFTAPTPGPNSIAAELPFQRQIFPGPLQQFRRIFPTNAITFDGSEHLKFSLALFHHAGSMISQGYNTYVLFLRLSVLLAC